MLEFHRDQQRHSGPEHLENLMIQVIQRIHDEQCEHQPNQLNQRNHNYQRDDARKRDGNDLSALVNRHQPPLGAYLVKCRGQILYS